MRDGGLPRFSADEYARRRAAVDRLADQERLDALVLFGTGGGDLGTQYLSGWPATREAWLVYVPARAATLFVQFYNHLPNARQVALADDVRWGGLSSSATIADHLRELGFSTGRIGLVGGISFQHHGVLAAKLPDATLVDVTRSFTRLRLIKSEEEIAWVRRAAELSDDALAALERQALPGLPEVELGAIVDEAYLRTGAHNTIHFFGVTSMASPSVCVPAQRPYDRRLEAGDVLFVELGAQLWSYSAQILRTVAPGLLWLSWSREVSAGAAAAIPRHPLPSARILREQVHSRPEVATDGFPVCAEGTLVRLFR